MSDSITTLFDRIGGPRRALMIAVGIGAAALIFFVAQWAGAPTWVPVMVNVPLESVSAITTKLEGAGIKTRGDRGGSDIMVMAPDLIKARVALAAGGIPSTGRPGMELFDQPSWGMTDYTQRINYRRALEGELERTIGKMRGIDGAQVHLVMHENDGFAAQDKPAEASVVLKVKGEAEPEVVKGIAHLIASSVDGLTSEHVTIVNDAGRMLSEGEETTLAGLTSRQLEQQREIEESLRQKAEKIVSQVVGASNLRVQVSAAMNFDRIERHTATVDPDKQVVAVEQKAEITPGAQGGAGQNNTSTQYENTRSTESYFAAPGSIKRLSVAVLIADKPPVDPKAKNAKSTPRTPAELAQLKLLVKSAVGADSLRGDVVTVENVAFAQNAVVTAEATKTDFIKVVETAQRPLLGLAGLGLIVFVVLFSLKSLKSGAASHNAPVLALSSGDQQMGAALASVGVTPLALPKDTARDRVASSIEQAPDAAARVVRSWLKEA